MPINVYQGAKQYHLFQNIHFAPLPPGFKQRLDYDTRTDGQPVYIGVAQMDVADSDGQWNIYKYTYNASDFLTLTESAYGSWDAKVSLFS